MNSQMASFSANKLFFNEEHLVNLEIVDNTYVIQIPLVGIKNPTIRQLE